MGYREVMDQFPEAVVVHDGESVLFVNKEGLRLVGAQTWDEVSQRPLLSFVPPAYLTLVRDRIAAVARGETAATPVAHERFLRLDGSEVDVEVRSMAIRYGGRPAIQLVARELSRRQQELRSLLDDMSVGVLLQGPDSEILLSNPRALELLGLTEDQLLGRTSFDPMWNVIHPDGTVFPGADHPVPRALATGRAVRDVVMGVYRPGKGDRVWLNVDAVLQRSAAGARLQVVCTFIDVTERQAAEDRVKNLLAEKDLILQEVHHRIKNNMATIKGLLFLHAERLPGSAAASALRDAESRVQAVMVLYDKLYRSMDRQALSVRDYLPGLLEEILANFPGGREIQVVSEIEDFCLGAEVLQPLGIIVNELVTNAMKYAFPRRSRGSIFLSVTRTGPRVRVAFRDDGEGVPPGFDPRAAAGFGLSLVRLLADSLRARLAFEPGAGLGVVLEFDT